MLNKILKAYLIVVLFVAKHKCVREMSGTESGTYLKWVAERRKVSGDQLSNGGDVTAVQTDEVEMVVTEHRTNESTSDSNWGVNDDGVDKWDWDAE